MMRLHSVKNRIGDLRRYRGLRRLYGLPVGRVGGFLEFFKPKKTILFFPERPWPDTVEYKLCAVLGYAISDDPLKPCDVAFRRADRTLFPARDSGVTRDLKVRVINRDCFDISKKTVDWTFGKIFGYSLEIDPTAFCGVGVAKSD